ncbi:BQ5605_C005g03486 [Microbotryum silenes-dioicae]|uniref:BQ5605_C005g03486 protein n=1 Tax=Microbotryum silenes-dioicae TaxID=796604 RepID=A0A2X0N4U0_9BASI|nr:BQ5605_C005g03486 [Microbotryum silenes-dioicae]
MHSSLSVAHHRETARLPSCSPQPVPPLLPYLPRAPSQRFSPSIPMLPLAPMPTISHHKAARSYEVRSSTAPSGSLATSSHTNIYVRLLPPETRDSDLLALGSYWGRVISVRAILSHPPPPYPTRRHCLPSNTTCKGVGFILYENSHQALSAISGLRQIGFEASLARDSLNLRLRQLADEGSTNLYLSNLPTAFGEEDLIHLLRPARVLSVRLLRQNDAIPASQRLSPGPSRGIGFARIADRDAADEVIERLQAVFLPGSNAPLRVRYGERFIAWGLFHT